MVDISGWPAEDYPTGASGVYRYVSEDRYEGPKDGRMPGGGPTGFVITRKSHDDLWTLMSTVGPGGEASGYPWDNHNSPVDCPDGNASWVSGAIVEAP